MSKTKQPKACLENIHRLLTDQKRWRFAFNEMGGVVMCNDARLTGPTITEITRWCHTRAVMVGSQAVAEVVTELADAHRVHPVRDYLDGLPGTATSASRWLITYLGAQDTPYTRAIGRKWLISAVARAMKPGCQGRPHARARRTPGHPEKLGARARSAMTTPGFSRTCATSTARTPSCSSAANGSSKSPNFKASSGAENARLKAFLSTRLDNYRPPYARVGQDFPRSVVFAGTVNEDEYLKDPTGGRRFWCFQCGTINLPGLRSA